MRIKLFIGLLLFSQFVIAESLVNKIITIDPGKKEVVRVNTTKAVSVNVSFTDISYKETEKCGSCLHLSHQLNDGHINQKNSSNYGTGFIQVQPDKESVIIIVKHDYKDSRKIKIEINTVKQ